MDNILLETGSFDKVRCRLEKQYTELRFNPETGPDIEELKARLDRYQNEHSDESRILMKAHLFSIILEEGRIGVDPEDFFADKLDHGGLLVLIRREWQKKIEEEAWKSEMELVNRASRVGAFGAQLDTGHTSPDWENLLRYGPAGIRDRARFMQEEIGASLSNEQKDFYKSVEIVFGAVCVFCYRLSKEALKTAEKFPEYSLQIKCVSEALLAISKRPPETLHEALQLAYIHHELQEMEGELVRSMGGFDNLYFPFYKRDITNGIMIREQAKELIKFFFFKFFAKTQGKAYGKNFYFAGQYADGSDIVNELSYLAFEAYREMSVVDPKLSVRVYKETPIAFLAMVAQCIRMGNNSIVFVNDEVAIPMLISRGKTLEEARSYLLIGCYEPAVMGKDISCSMAATINLAKSVELSLYNGIDPLTGERIGVQTGELDDFIKFKSLFEAYKKQLAYQLQIAMMTVRTFETRWCDINPSPLLSGTMTECMVRGQDVSQRGAKYNDSGCMCGCLASAADSLMVIKELVFERKACTLYELKQALDHNWEGAQELWRKARYTVAKWGNNRCDVDRIAKDITNFAASEVNREPNGRGGCFAVAMFSIDYNYRFGIHTGALPDGRKSAQPLSKNLCAMTAMDNEGVTSLINSVTKLDFTRFPDGSVLDVLLHPTAVQGEDGLAALVSIIKTYFHQGGYAMQINIFDADMLRDAQRNPERYANLQVRVCGWNAYFINLSPAEQEEFIKAADGYG